MTNSNIFHPRNKKTSSPARRPNSAAKKPVKVDMPPARPVAKIPAAPTKGSPDENRKFIEQLVRKNALLEKENKMLKNMVVKLEAKITEAKDVAVSIANFSRRNNSADRGMLMDWSSKILRIFNQK